MSVIGCKFLLALPMWLQTPCIHALWPLALVLPTL